MRDATASPQVACAARPLVRSSSARAVKVVRESVPVPTLASHWFSRCCSRCSVLSLACRAVASPQRAMRGWASRARCQSGACCVSAACAQPRTRASAQSLLRVAASSSAGDSPVCCVHQPSGLRRTIWNSSQARWPSDSCRGRSPSGQSVLNGSSGVVWAVAAALGWGVLPGAAAAVPLAVASAGGSGGSGGASMCSVTGAACPAPRAAAAFFSSDAKPVAGVVAVTCTNGRSRSTMRWL